MRLLGTIVQPLSYTGSSSRPTTKHLSFAEFEDTSNLDSLIAALPKRGDMRCNSNENNNDENIQETEDRVKYIETINIITT